MRITGEDGIANGCELTLEPAQGGLVEVEIDATPRPAEGMASITLTPPQARAVAHELVRLADQQEGLPV